MTSNAPTAAELQETCRELIAGDEVPRTLRFLDSAVPSPTGEADYRWAGTTLNVEV